MKSTIQPNNRINQHILWEIVTCALVVFCVLIQQYSLTSLFIGLAFVLVVWQMLTVLKRGMKTLGMYAMILSLFALAICCHSTMLARRTVDFSYFNFVIIFVSTLMLLCTAINDRTNHATALLILRANLIISLFFPIAYFFFTYETTPAGLELNFSNQNLLAIWLCLYVLYAVLCIVGMRGFWRAVAVGSLGINVYLTYLTQSRNVYIALLLFAVLFMIVRLKQVKQFPRWFLLLLILLPLLIIPIYLLLIDPVTELGWLDFMISEGKPLNTRVLIWNRGFRLLKGHWLTGFYSNIYMRGNQHNLYMVVLCSYGAPMLAAVIVYLYRIVNCINRKVSTSFGAVALCAFFTVLFMGIAEGALFSGGLNIFIPTAGFLYLANSDYCQPPKKESKPRRVQNSKYLK